MKNKFKQWDRVNLYNPRISGYGKKQFVIIGKQPVKTLAIEGCLSNPNGITPTPIYYYAVMLNEKVKYIPENELRLAVPYLRVGDKVIRTDSDTGDIYTIVHFEEQDQVLVKFANGSEIIDIYLLQLINEAWYEYCEIKYKDIVVPPFKTKCTQNKKDSSSEMKESIGKSSIFSKITDIFGKKEYNNKEEEEK